MLLSDAGVQPISENTSSGKNIVPLVILSILFTLLICGGVFYWWYKTNFEKVREKAVEESILEVQKEIDELRKEVLYFQKNAGVGRGQITNDYIRALKTANLFLSAIIKKDQAGALKYVSPHAKTIYGVEKFKTAVSGLFGDYFQGFEVFTGQLIEDNTYQFNVFLYKEVSVTNSLTGEASKPDTIRVVKDTRGEWYIDGLPEAIVQFL